MGFPGDRDKARQAQNPVGGSAWGGLAAEFRGCWRVSPEVEESDTGDAMVGVAPARLLEGNKCVECAGGFGDGTAFQRSATSSLWDLALRNGCFQVVSLLVFLLVSRQPGVVARWSLWLFRQRHLPWVAASGCQVGQRIQKQGGPLRGRRLCVPSHVSGVLPGCAGFFRWVLLEGVCPERRTGGWFWAGMGDAGKGEKSPRAGLRGRMVAGRGAGWIRTCS